MSAHKRILEREPKKFELILNEQWPDTSVIDVDSVEKKNNFQLTDIGVAKSARPEASTRDSYEKGLKYLVNSSRADFERELNVAAKMSKEGEDFFKYPVATVFSPNNVSENKESEYKFVEYGFNSADDKYKALILLEVELEKISSNEVLVTSARTIVDEMFTNAIYNAPEQALGKEQRRAFSGSERVETKSGRIFMGKNDSFLLIGCEDQYGSLDTKGLMERIHKCYDSGVDSVVNLSKEGGVGIGTYMLFNTATSFYVGVKPGESTIVMCAIPRNLSNRKVQRMAKNFHLLDLKG